MCFEFTFQEASVLGLQSKLYPPHGRLVCLYKDFDVGSHAAREDARRSPYVVICANSILKKGIVGMSYGALACNETVASTLSRLDVSTCVAFILPCEAWRRNQPVLKC